MRNNGRTVRAVVKEPGKKAEDKRIKNTLEAYQEVVGGYIETVTLATDMIIVCNEEGRLMDLPYNCNICGIDFYGPILLIGSSRDDFCSLEATETALRKLLPQLYAEEAKA